MAWRSWWLGSPNPLKNIARYLRWVEYWLMLWLTWKKIYITPHQNGGPDVLIVFSSSLLLLMGKNRSWLFGMVERCTTILSFNSTKLITVFSRIQKESSLLISPGGNGLGQTAPTDLSISRILILDHPRPCGSAIAVLEMARGSRSDEIQPILRRCFWVNFRGVY